MTKQEEFLAQAVFCLQSAQSASDPEFRTALLELVLWWADEADRVSIAEMKSSGAAQARQ
jgi:hypothetical protein